MFRCSSILTSQSDTLVIPVRILPEPDSPLIYVPVGALVKAAEDLDVLLQGIAIVERDGVYGEGEMQGGNPTHDMDETNSKEVMSTVYTPSRAWQGKVRLYDNLVNCRVESC